MTNISLLKIVNQRYWMTPLKSSCIEKYVYTAANNNQLVSSYAAGCLQLMEWMAVAAAGGGGKESCMTVSDSKRRANYRDR